MDYKKLTELDPVITLSDNDLIDVSVYNGGNWVSNSASIATLVNNSSASTTYLKLDASNDPITGDLDLGLNDISNVNALTVIGDFVNQDPNSIDMGYSNIHDNRGYNNEYINDKEIYNSAIKGHPNTPQEGSIRMLDGVLSCYLNGVWADIVTGFRFREDSDEGYELEHKPIGFYNWYEVSSGNSNEKGLNGLPITQQYTTSMGAYPVPLEIDGGTF